MKISELPEPYRSLARFRSKVKGEDDLAGAFAWDYTPEGWEFWYEVSKGEHPAIPEISLAELENL